VAAVSRRVNKAINVQRRERNVLNPLGLAAVNDELSRAVDRTARRESQLLASSEGSTDGRGSTMRWNYIIDPDGR
jgi:hypothetical protein